MESTTTTLSINKSQECQVARPLIGDEGALSHTHDYLIQQQENGHNHQHQQLPQQQHNQQQPQTQQQQPHQTLKNYSTAEGNYHLDDDQSKPSTNSDEPEQMRKLFIGGLDYKTSEATLRQHFEKFGDVTDCVVMRDPQSKKSRGFGFVIYANSSMLDRVQDARPHEVDGREVQSKRAISREDSGKPEAQATVKKVYLGGLSDDIAEDELRDYFKEFGTIVNVTIVAHKDTGKRRGFAFVEYDDYDPVDKIVMKKFHTIKDKRIEAKKAIPKKEMDARKGGDSIAALFGPSLDGPGGRGRSNRNPASFLWNGVPFNAPGYPVYSGSLDGYPPHYHSPPSHHTSPENWLVHTGPGNLSYGFRGAHGVHGRNNYINQAVGWPAPSSYANFSALQRGGPGPVRISYPHRSQFPYGAYGSHRGRGYNH